MISYVLDNQTAMPQPNNSEPVRIFQSQLSPGADYVVGTYLLLLACSSVVLNAAVIVTIFFKKNDSPSASIELYILNLSFVDMFQAGLSSPMSTISSFTHGWYFHFTGCVAYAVIVFFFATSAIALLTLMSVHRYIKVCHPALDRWFCQRAVRYLVVVCYIYGGFWTVCPLLGWGCYGVERNNTQCSIDWVHTPTSYILCIMVGIFVVPVLIMTTCYVKIVLQIRRRKNHRAKNSGSSIVKVTIFMCTSFMIAWTPYSVLGVVEAISKSETSLPMLFHVLAPLFAKSSTVYNPIIYFFAIRRFRNEFWKNVCACVDDKPSSEDGKDKIMSSSLMTYGPAYKNGIPQN